MGPGERHSVTLTLLDLKWASNMASLWPHKALGDVVPDGRYHLELHVGVGKENHVVTRAVARCGGLPIVVSAGVLAIEGTEE